MQSINGGLGFNLTLNNEDFNRRLRESMRGVTGFSTQAQAEINGIQTGFGNLGKAVAGFLTVAAASSFIQEMVKIRGEFEQLEIAFTTMLGSKEKADTLMAQIVDFAGKTPFGLKSTSEATKMLLAYGESAETALGTMRKLGDIASGVGIPLKDIAYLYGTTMTQGRMYTQDLNQFLGRGIPMMDELAKLFGVAKEDVKKLVEEGKVGFPELEKVIDNLTASGSKFGGLMEAQSKSIVGQIEQLKDAFDVMLNNLGKEAQPVVSTLISGAATMVENYDKFLRVLATVIATYGTYRTALMLVNIAQGANAAITGLARKAWVGLNAAMKSNPIALLLSLLAGLVASLVDLEDILSKAEIEFSGVSAEMEANTEHNKLLSKSLADTKSKIDPLIAVIKDETASLNVRKRAYGDLIKQHPEFIDTLDNEYKATQKLDTAYKNLIQRLDEAALARAREGVRQKRAQNLADAEASEYDAKLRADAEIKANERIAKDNEKRAKKYQTDIKNSTRESTDLSYVSKATSSAAQKDYEETKKISELAKKDMDDYSEYSKKWYKEQKDLNETPKGLGLSKDKNTKKTTTKKADDPVELFKKQLAGMESEYDRYFKLMNSNDEILKNGASAIFDNSLAQKGNTYLEYLRNVQSELTPLALNSDLARKKLLAVNDELAKEIDFSVIDEFKKKIDKEIDNAKSLLEVANILNEAKNGLENDQLGVNKKKYLDDKGKQNAEDIAKANKQQLDEMNKQFDEQYSFLDTKRKEYNADMLILQEQYNKASNESEKRRIQDLINIRGAQYHNDTNGKTNNVEVNKVLEESKTLAQKRIDIENEANEKIALIHSAVNAGTSEAQLKVFNDSITEIKRKQKEALSAVDKEILEKSKGWVQIFGDYANKSSEQLVKILDKIRTVLNDPESEKNLSPEQLKALQDQFTSIKDKLEKDNPFAALSVSFKKFKDDAKKGFKDLDGSISFNSLKGLLDSTRKGFDEVFDIAEGLGINVSDSTKEAVELGFELLEAGGMIAEGIASKDPVKIIQGVAKAIGSIFKAKDKRLDRQIKNYQNSVNALTNSFKDLEYATSKALGSDSYKNQKLMMDNLVKQQAEYQKMINAEKRKKKKDNGKISEWEQAMKDSAIRVKEIMDDMAQNILQTNAKDLSSTLGDALVEAFGKGEDAALAFEKVASDVLKNAIVNQLKEQFLENELKSALDKLYTDMGGDKNGNFNWNGLTPQEQQDFRDKIKEISGNFTAMLGEYSNMFDDMLPDPNEDALVGAIKGVSEETAGLIAGHMNAIRILSDLTNKIVTDSNTFARDSNMLLKDSNAILRNCLTELATISYNTSFNRNIDKQLGDIYQHIKSTGDSSRAHGF